MEFISLFVPGIISSRIHLKYFGNKSTEEKVSLYLIYTFVINLIVFTFLNFYCENAYTVFNDDLFSLIPITSCNVSYGVPVIESNVSFGLNSPNKVTVKA